MGVVYDVLREPGVNRDANAHYNRELAALTAASWRAQAETDD